MIETFASRETPKGYDALARAIIAIANLDQERSPIKKMSRQ